MSNKNYAFGKTNFILLAIGLAIIIIGFILMSGGATTDEAFNPAIFDARHIKVAPVITFLGFVSIIVAIVYKPKDKEEGSKEMSSKELSSKEKSSKEISNRK
jgi:membrane-bound ClpP family serine protease